MVSVQDFTAFQTGTRALEDHRPQLAAAWGRLHASFVCLKHGVSHFAEHVELLLCVGGVADPHRAGILVALQVIQNSLGKVRLAVDAVDDLEIAAVARVCDEHRVPLVVRGAGACVTPDGQTLLTPGTVFIIRAEDAVDQIAGVFVLEEVLLLAHVRLDAAAGDGRPLCSWSCM